MNFATNPEINKHFNIPNLPISSGTRQHLVDADDVERMQTHTDVELVLAAELDQVLVAANTSCFQSFGAQLFVLIGHQVDAQREILDGGLLATEIEDTDFRIWDTTAEPRLRVWLVFTVAITGKKGKSKVRFMFGYLY